MSLINTLYDGMTDSNLVKVLMSMGYPVSRNHLSLWKIALIKNRTRFCSPPYTNKIIRWHKTPFVRRDRILLRFLWKSYNSQTVRLCREALHLLVYLRASSLDPWDHVLSRPTFHPVWKLYWNLRKQGNREPLEAVVLYDDPVADVDVVASSCEIVKCP